MWLVERAMWTSTLQLLVRADTEGRLEAAHYQAMRKEWISRQRTISCGQATLGSLSGGLCSAQGEKVTPIS